MPPCGVPYSFTVHSSIQGAEIWGRQLEKREEIIRTEKFWISQINAIGIEFKQGNAEESPCRTRRMFAGMPYFS